MRRLVVVCLCAAASVVVGVVMGVEPTSAAHAKAGSSPIFRDCAAGEPCFTCLPTPCADGTLDFEGPSGFGAVRYSQDDSGDLTFSVTLKHAVPNTTYDVSFACGGASHGEVACPSFAVGTVTTSGAGKGKSESFTIDFVALDALPEDAAHVDVSSTSSGFFVAPSIQFET